MEDLSRLFLVFRDFSVRDAVDILLVGYLVYRLLLLVRGTRAWRIILGIMTFVVLLLGSAALELRTLHWVLDKAALLGPVALVILLLPELRQTLEGFGKLGFWPQQLVGGVEEKAEARTVEAIVAAVSEMASERVGALIVIEMGAPLDEIVGNGVLINATISTPLLNAIFFDGNPLHDGAAIIRGDKVLAAACRLPLSDSMRIDPHAHMRHRAAVGVTEVLDCLSIVVSEERGSISFAAEGKLRKLDSHNDLREILNKELRGVKREEQRPPKRSKRKSVEVKP